MKPLFALILATLSCHAFALGGFKSLDTETQTVLTWIVDQLGIKDNSHSTKMKLHDAIDFMFEGDWNTNWLGLNDVAASRYQDGRELGYIELLTNSAEHGTVSITFNYQPSTKQIISTTRQVRYTTRKALLDIYNERKANKEEYNLEHENDHYAMLSKVGLIDYEYYHVGSDSGSITYVSQNIIDL